MRLKTHHTPYIARRIARDIAQWVKIYQKIIEMYYIIWEKK